MRKRFEVFTTLTRDPLDPGVLWLRVGGGGWRWLGLALLAFGLVGITVEVMDVRHWGLPGIFALIFGAVMTVPWKTVEFRRREGRVLVRTGIYVPFIAELKAVEEEHLLTGDISAGVGCETDYNWEPDRSPTPSGEIWNTFLVGQDPAKKVTVASFSFRRTAQALAAALNKDFGLAP